MKIWAVQFTSGGEGDYYETIYGDRYFLSEDSALALCLQLVKEKGLRLSDDFEASEYESRVGVVSFEVEP